MKTYIVNLERSKERKLYMEKILKYISWVDYEFVSAVDGKKMTAIEQQMNFDIEKFKKRYSVSVRPGEIGCTLSHQKCYRKIVEENIPYALILEDDISISDNIQKVILTIEQQIQSYSEPLVVLLSGLYWYTNTHPLVEGYRIANVYNAFLTHSYIINQSAAQILIEDRPFILADDWFYIRKRGVKMLAILPHLINQNWNEIQTTINIESVEKKKFKWKLYNAPRLLKMRILKILGHYDPA